jgi:hypothetical protein
VLGKHSTTEPQPPPKIRPLPLDCMQLKGKNWLAFFVGLGFELRALRLQNRCFIA